MHSGALKSVLKRRSFSALVLTAFGTFWALVGASGLNAAVGWLPLLVLSLIAILLLVASIRLIRAVRRMSPVSAPPEERKRSRNYRLINMLQVVAMMGTVAVLSLIHHQEYILPVWAFIVGLHFFALVNILQRRLYYVVGLAMCGLVLLTVLLVPLTAHLGGTQIFPWAVVIGSGCALILWLTVAETLFQVRTQLQQKDILPLPGL